MALLPDLIRNSNISYITTGENVAHGNLNIKCPFCGPADPSYHMGVRLEDGAWACWRDTHHRGRRPHRLLRLLFGWSWSEIDLICGGSPVVRDELESTIETLKHWGHPIVKDPRPRVVLPPSFLRIDQADLGAGPAIRYLIEKRGFREEEISALAEEYDLYYQPVGDWVHRVLFPVRNLEGELVGWTGRTWNKQVDQRYKSTSRLLGTPLTQHLWHLPELWEAGYRGEGRILVVTEGPFDALKLDWYGQAQGIRGTCLFGSSCYPDQQALLEILGGVYDQLVVALDNTNLAGTLETSLRRLPNQAQVSLIPGRKDIGELSADQIVRWCDQLQLLTRRKV